MIEIWGGATSRTIRPHWMAHELSLDYQPKLIGPRTGETQTPAFRILNPKEKIPVLVDGELVLSESAAIVTYLADTYGRDSGLIPKPYTSQRALYNQWLSFIQMELDAHTLYIIRKHRDLANLYGDAPAAIDAAIAGFNKQVNVAENALVSTHYLVDDQFTGADIMLVSVLTWAVAYGMEISPRLAEYSQLHTTRPAFKTAAELNFSISPST
ncbi:MAG: glutathione S-transferase family protein [Gammaproteobacteria bacterium]|nr:glutathione S-transferase family protein [Gammaproteobacteria bacterium]